MWRSLAPPLSSLASSSSLSGGTIGAMECRSSSRYIRHLQVTKDLLGSLMVIVVKVSLNHISPWLGGGEAPEQGATSPPSVPECKVYIGVHRVYNIGHELRIYERDWCTLGN